MIDTIKKHLPDSQKVATIKICLVSFLHACLVASIAGDIFAIWLQDKIHLDGAEIGLLLGLKGGVAIFFKPFFGYFLDKLLLRKHLIYAIAICAVGTGPFFQFIYGPLLTFTHTATVNGVTTTTHPYLYLTALLGGIYLGFMFYAGSAVIFSYCDRFVRAHGGTYGIVNAFNLAGWGVMAPISGFLYVYGAIYTFYFCSALAVIFVIVVFSLKVKSFEVDEVAESEDAIAGKVIPEKRASFKDYFRLCKSKNFFNLILFNMLIVVVLYSQSGQFGRYFLTFWGADKESHAFAIRLISMLGVPVSAIAFVLSMYSSKVIAKIGPQKAMVLLAFLVAGFLFVSGFAGLMHSKAVIIIARLIFASINPLITVAVLAYVAVYFNMKISGMVYLIGFQLMNNFGSFLESPAIGKSFDVYGFAHTYIALACIVAVSGVVLILSFTFFSKKIVMRHVTKPNKPQE